jgi:PIN domain nuclease of toxin-antitoxin system
LKPRYLLDTHSLIYWLTVPKKVTHQQARVLREAVSRSEPVAISAVTLLEIAVLFGEESTRTNVSVASLFEELEANPLLEIVPFTVEVAAEVAAIGTALRDPADRAIVCTARIRNLQLITSDQRILQSKLVQVVE